VEHLCNAYRNFSDLQRKYNAQEGYLLATESRYVRSGSKNIGRADVLSILFGYQLPLFLRPQPDGKYEIIVAGCVEDITNERYLRNQRAYVVMELVIE
jgi:hypothetical protein